MKYQRPWQYQITYKGLCCDQMYDLNEDYYELSCIEAGNENFTKPVTKSYRLERKASESNLPMVPKG